MYGDRVMSQKDVSVGSTAEQEPETHGVVGVLEREAKMFFEHPFGYAIDRVCFCLVLGFVISILLS